MAYRGKYSPLNIDKYKGNPENIIYRSRWERQVMAWLDKSPNVKWWSSEEMSLTYFNPVDKDFHNYYPDFIFCQKVGKDKERVVMLEVKPYKQTQPPIKPKTRMTKRYLEELATYGKNLAKWDAAKAYCDKNGWKFQILTENDVRFAR